MKTLLFSNRIILVLLLIFSITGTLFQLFSTKNLVKDVDAIQFQTDLWHQLAIAEEYAEKTVQQAEKTIDYLKQNPIPEPGITEVFLYNKGKLAYWSTNELAFRFPELIHTDGWNYEHTANVHGLFRWYETTDSTALLLLVPIKSAFPYENQYLRNEFKAVFGLPNSVQLSDQPDTNSNPVQDADGNYLFSISSHIALSASTPIAWWGFISFSIAFIFSLIVYLKISVGNNKLSTPGFFIITVLFFVIIVALSWFETPGLFFQNPVFEPHHFTVNQLFKTYTQLSVLVIFIASALYSCSVRYTFNRYRTTTILASVVYFLALGELLKNIIYHSGSNFNFYLLNEVSFINSWSHILLFVSLAGGYSILHMAAPGIFRYRFPAVGIYFFVATLLCLGLTHHLNQNKKNSKYQVLAENIRMNGTTVKDPVAELLLEDFAFNLQNDSRLRLLATNRDSSAILYEYIQTKHAQLFKNKFDIAISVVDSDQNELHDYKNMLKNTGTAVGSTGFFSVPASLFESSYAGFIQLSDTSGKAESSILFEFQNKRNFRSYSFPDLLINESGSTTQHTDISIAYYENNQLTYSDNRFEWPEENLSLQLPENGFSKVKILSEAYYVYQNDQQSICIKELVNAGKIDKIFYFILITAIFLVLGRVLIALHDYLLSRKKITIGLTGKFQLVFISLLMMSFLSTLLFSVNYFRKNYEKEQIQLSEKKKHYIQSSLQEIFFWANNLNSISEERMNTILQELAYRFQTDIHIYTLNGELAGSSLNLIFSKQLVSRLISPEVMFGDATASFHYEKIGHLRYLTGFAELINGDYLPIGYIAVPQYLSQNEINSKINQFLIAVIQIFALIIILSIILVLLSGNRLAIPLKLLEEKLKTMKLNGSNARIEYKGNDEIGQLVEQYNKTVDELEKSTQLLVQSERESAWRTMARQVAHEINNPLTPMKLTIQQLQRLRTQSDEQFNDYFSTASKTLIEQIDNLSRIAGSFSQFARLPETHTQPVEIAERLFSAVELFKNYSERIEIVYHGVQSGILVLGDPEQFTRVFTNLLKNAVQAIPEQHSGRIEIFITLETQKVKIQITDNGTGISADAQKQLFKPNFTTKTSGMGLGLSISKAIIENAGGSIRFMSSEGKGSTFTVYLPVLN